MKFFSTFSQKYLEVVKKAVSLQRFREIERIKLNELMKGRLAQLVQSICLTSRGSAVRIRQRPPLFKSNHDYMVAFFIFPTNTKAPYSPTIFKRRLTQQKGRNNKSRLFCFLPDAYIVSLVQNLTVSFSIMQKI